MANSPPGDNLASARLGRCQPGVKGVLLTAKYCRWLRIAIDVRCRAGENRNRRWVRPNCGACTLTSRRGDAAWAREPEESHHCALPTTADRRPVGSRRPGSRGSRPHCPDPQRWKTGADRDRGRGSAARGTPERHGRSPRLGSGS